MIMLLRRGPPGEAAAWRQLRQLIDRMDETSRRVLRSDPDLARALWLLDLATMKDRHAERIRTKERRLRCAIAVSILLVILGLSLFLGATLTVGRWMHTIESALPSAPILPTAWPPHPHPGDNSSGP